VQRIGRFSDWLWAATCYKPVCRPPAQRQNDFRAPAGSLLTPWTVERLGRSRNLCYADDGRLVLVGFCDLGGSAGPKSRQILPRHEPNTHRFFCRVLAWLNKLKLLALLDHTLDRSAIRYGWVLRKSRAD